MARIFQDGFETVTLSNKGDPGTIVGSPWVIGTQNQYCYYTISSQYGRTGNGLRVYASAGSATGDFSAKLSPAQSELYVRFYINIRSVSSSGSVQLFALLDANGNRHMAFRFAPAGGLVNVRLYVGDTDTGQFFTVPLGLWVMIEVHLLVGAAGIVEIRRNGELVLSWQGNTQGARGATVGHIAIASGSTVAGEVWFDDVAVNDTQGTVNNGWVGPGSVRLLAPNGNAQSQWTLVGASFQYQAVDEFPPDGDTSYVEAPSVGAEDLYAMADTGASSSATIKAVRWLATAKQTASGTRFVPVLNVGGTKYTGPELEPGVDYTFLTAIWDVNPATGQPWSPSDVDALQAGVRRTA